MGQHREARNSPTCKWTAEQWQMWDSTSVRGRWSYQNQCWNWFSIWKNETEPCLIPHTKKSPRWRPKHEIQNYKLSEENRAKYINDFGVWRDFLRTTKAQTIRERMRNPIKLTLRTGHQKRCHFKKSEDKPQTWGGKFCNTCNQKEHLISRTLKYQLEQKNKLKGKWVSL